MSISVDVLVTRKRVARAALSTSVAEGTETIARAQEAIARLQAAVKEIHATIIEVHATVTACQQLTNWNAPLNPETPAV